MKQKRATSGYLDTTCPRNFSGVVSRSSPSPSPLRCAAHAPWAHIDAAQPQETRGDRRGSGSGQRRHTACDDPSGAVAAEGAAGRGGRGGVQLVDDAQRNREALLPAREPRGGAAAARGV
eukprot:scaffold111538_cov63-Phaeocystis_antarctica.AAC.1